MVECTLSEQSSWTIFSSRPVVTIIDDARRAFVFSNLKLFATYREATSQSIHKTVLPYFPRRNGYPCVITRKRGCERHETDRDREATQTQPERRKTYDTVLKNRKSQRSTVLLLDHAKENESPRLTCATSIIPPKVSGSDTWSDKLRQHPELSRRSRDSVRLNYCIGIIYCTANFLVVIVVFVLTKKSPQTQ